ncbi:hypothetical protein B0H16DRAFT_1575661 [Mycena metata]|uniref:Uncharacterized protein n=1 Tax=Mycena metata TaxID=1033252 RepID=A0AAD7MWB1_9AGAR|nr:hypothetical protein B0H16DRAFT_1575661 [Mycena metata]
MCRIPRPDHSGGRNIRTKGRNELERAKCLGEDLRARKRTSLSRGPSGSGSGSHGRPLCCTALLVRRISLRRPFPLCQNFSHHAQVKPVKSMPSNTFNTRWTNFPRPSAICQDLPQSRQDLLQLIQDSATLQAYLQLRKTVQKLQRVVIHVSGGAMYQAQPPRAQPRPSLHHRLGG